jgi:AraC family transcriptional activator of tynA and feaB
MLPDDTGWLGLTAEETVMNQALDLVAVSLSKAADWRRPGVSSARSLVLMKRRAAIKGRLSDPTVDAQAIATAAGSAYAAQTPAR